MRPQRVFSSFIKTLSAAALLISLFIASAAAETSAPQSSLESFVSAVKEMDFSASEKQAALVKKADSFLDLDSMGKKALSAHWENASPDQRAQFLNLLWQLIEKTAYKRSRDFLGSLKITYPNESADSTGVRVTSILRQEEQGIDTEVIYHLTQQTGVWKIDDVFLDGVSIIEDLKYQFDKIIADSKFDGLLETMRQRLADAEKKPNA